jgi:mannosyltransferase OCH1-like enzyme
MQYPCEVINAYKKKEPWVYADFDVSMKTDKYMQTILETIQIAGYDGLNFISLCRNLYNANQPGCLAFQDTPKIPKIIHQIWIGSPVPEVLEKYRTSWLKKHAREGWTYILWTDEKVAKIKLHNQKYYDAAENLAHKADMLRYEIVYQFGGVYIDMDFECLQPLDLFHYGYDFYTALQPLDTNLAQLGLALFGAVPKHPILKHAILTIKKDWEQKGVTRKSGPVHFTKSFVAMAGKDNRIDIAFPASYFYPLGAFEVIVHRRKWLEEGAFAVHWWAKSWMPENFRRKDFREINNYETVQTWRD